LHRLHPPTTVQANLRRRTELAACSAVEGEQKYESFDLQPACVTIARYYHILTKAQQATPSGKESRDRFQSPPGKDLAGRWKVVAAGGWGGRKIPIHMLTHSGTYRLTPTRVHPASSAAACDGTATLSFQQTKSQAPSDPAASFGKHKPACVN